MFNFEADMSFYFPSMTNVSLGFCCGVCVTSLLLDWEIQERVKSRDMFRGQAFTSSVGIYVKCNFHV